MASGATESASLPTTSGAFDESYNGAGDTFASRFVLPVAALASNYATDAPGSYFTIDASGFDPVATLEVTVNGMSLGTVISDGQGDGTFLIHTEGADPGTYIVTVGEIAFEVVTLDPSAPLRPPEETAPVFEIRAGIAYVEASYLPISFNGSPRVHSLGVRHLSGYAPLSSDGAMRGRRTAPLWLCPPITRRYGHPRA